LAKSRNTYLRALGFSFKKKKKKKKKKKRRKKFSIFEQARGKSAVGE
jgi:hypothetical protein